MSRIKSLHFLRGLACSLVIIDHMFFSTKYFNIGACGIGIFFLVSGFVIPISLKNVTPIQFMIRRCFRLYPVAIVSTLLIIFFNKFFFRIWIDYPTVPKLPDTPSLKDFIFTVTQIWDLFDIPVFRPIFWTLVIEEKFYWIMASSKHFNKDNDYYKTVIFGISFISIMFFLCFFMNNYHKSVLLRNMMFISYMYIGTCFYHLYTEKNKTIHIKKHIIIFISIFLFLLAFATSGKITDYNIYMIERRFGFSKYYIITSYSVSFVIFYLLFNKKMDFIQNNFLSKIKIKFMNIIMFIATISYPFYVIHTEIWNKIGINHSVHSGLLNNITYCVLCILLSYFIHKTIEMPFISIGKRLTKET